MNRRALLLALLMCASVCSAQEEGQDPPTKEEMCRNLGIMVSATAHKLRSCAGNDRQFKAPAARFDAHIKKHYPRFAAAEADAPWATFTREVGESSAYSVDSASYRHACKVAQGHLQQFIRNADMGYREQFDGCWRGTAPAVAAD